MIFQKLWTIGKCKRIYFLFFLALKRFHGSSEYRREMEDIQRECFALDGEKPKQPWQLFTDCGVRWQLITVIVMTMGQQLSGINAVRFHTYKQLK